MLIHSPLYLSDLLYVQHVKALGNRQTFHPNKLDYDVFNIEIDLGPVNLLLHGLFLKKLWWIKVKDDVPIEDHKSSFVYLSGKSIRLGSNIS